MENQERVSTDTTVISSNGEDRAIALSSTATLFWRIFIPVFCTVFLLGLTLAFWLTEEEYLRTAIPIFWIRLALLALLLGWIVLVRRTLWRLRRVDADSTFIYVTNYWLAVRYPWQDVERLSAKVYAGRKIMHIWLKAPGRFGQKISFLPGIHLGEWLDAHSKQHLLSEK